MVHQRNFAWVQSSILLFCHFFSYAYILEIKRIKGYHIKGIDSPLLLSLDIVIFYQETKKWSDWNPG